MVAGGISLKAQLAHELAAGAIVSTAIAPFHASLIVLPQPYARGVRKNLCENSKAKDR